MQIRKTSKNKKKSISKTKFRPSSPSLRNKFAFVLLFAFVGSYLLWRTFAVTTAVATIQGESLTPTSGASLISDSSADLGKALLFSSNSQAAGSVDLSSATNQLVLRARGTQCNGAPQAVVSINGAVVQTTSVSSTSWTDYAVQLNLASGAHTITVSFGNDYTETRGKGKGKTCDRNLYVDKLVFNGEVGDNSAPTAPQLSFTAANQQVTLSWTHAVDNVAVAKYEVWRNDAYLASLSPSVITYADSGLTNGTTYIYRVVAYDAVGNYKNSNAVTATPTATTAPPPSGINPSGQPMPVGDLPGWKQIFTDDFPTEVALGSFPSAVTDKWGAYPYPWRDTKGQQNSDPALGGWYHPQKVVSIKGGLMDLWIHTETIDGAKKRLVSAPQPRIKGAGTNAGSGQLYGRYAVRFRSDVLPGYKTAWLLWPDSGIWPRDGEIDFPEGDLDKTINGFMHWQGGTSGGDQHYALSNKTYTDWHTAVIEWGPNRCAFYLDGQLLTNATDGKSEWFTKVPNTPMHWVLQTETALEASVVPAETTQGHVQIDWVAVWAPQ